MNSSFRVFVLALTVSFIAATASATNYYIAASGSDSSNGTSKTTPWQHAPGMKNCTGTCAATTPKAGDQFIFRGGDTWHYGSGTPLVGGTWDWAWSGSSASPIYVGVDQTWFTGGSWARPVLNGDNPLSTSYVSSCATAYSEDIVLLNASYITFDDFEMTGICWNSTSANIAGMWDIPGGTNTNIIFSNNYCHGWTMVRSASDNFPCIQSFGGGTLADNWQIASNVFDGSDSPHFPIGDTTNCQWSGNTTDGCASGQGINGSHSWDVHDNVFRYLSNMIVTGNCHTVHDNLFEYLYNSFSGSASPQHPNVMNCLGGATGDNLYFYNNVMRHTFVTEDIYFAVRTNLYFFNNVMYDNMNSVWGLLPSGCIRFNAVSNSSSSQTAYIYNNTEGDASCQLHFAAANSPLTAWNGTAYFENNHFIGFSPSDLASTYSTDSGVSATISDSGHEVFQTTSAANGQGYTASNAYAPTTSSGATVGVGANLSSSCAAFSPDSSLCNGTSEGAGEQSGNGGKIVVAPTIAIVARQSSWDTGAYQFGSGGQLNPPTGLSAVVQ